jgi:lipoprotein signal peptidase
MDASGLKNNSNQNKKESTLKSSFFFFIVIFFCAIAIDQIGKHLARNIFYNANFAFSLPLPVWLIYVIYFFVLVGMSFYVFENYRKLNQLPKVAWALIFAGAISNIAERIFTGHVRDFIYITFLKLTGIYNLADFFIIIGIILLLIIPTSRLKQDSNDFKSF